MCADELTSFGLPPIKAEGTKIEFDGPGVDDPNAVKTTYVERRIPIELERKAHHLIDKFLQDNGFDPEEL